MKVSTLNHNNGKCEDASFYIDFRMSNVARINSCILVSGVRKILHARCRLIVITILLVCEFKFGVVVL